MPSFALIALFCRSEVPLPLECEDMSASISDTFVVPLVSMWSKSVSVLGSSTRGASDIASVGAAGQVRIDEGAGACKYSGKEQGYVAEGGEGRKMMSWFCSGSVVCAPVCWVICQNVIAPHWSGHDLFALHDDAHLQHTGFTMTKSSLPWTCNQHSCHC